MPRFGMQNGVSLLEQWIAKRTQVPILMHKGRIFTFRWNAVLVGHFGW